MKKLTITLDDDTAAWARVYAAREGKSVSRLLSEILQDRMRNPHHYNAALRNFLNQKPFHFEWIGGRRPSREKLNDRAGLR